MNFTFKRADAGALALALLDLRDVLLAVAAKVAQFVEGAIDAGANDAAIGKRERRLVFQRCLDARAQIGELVALRV